jgi:hypothetical protein
LVSHANGSTNTPGSNSSGVPSVSNSGNVIAFASYATNLVAGQQDTLNTLDIFAYDRIAGTTILASRVSGSTSNAGNGYSYNANVSGNGTVIAFASTSTNLVRGDFNQLADVFVFARPPKLLSVTINDGTSQRSRLTSLTVTFDGIAILPNSAAVAFELFRQSDGSQVDLEATVDYDGLNTVVTLTFTGGPVEFGSLADGRYTLTVFANAVNAGNFDGNNDGTIGDDFVLMGSPANGLFRLFGDSDGDAKVTLVDFAALRSAFGTASTYFDYDSNGFVGAADFAQFRQRMGVSLVP